ncbi:MAG: SUMF1/EgtB/PvdO family nonheme iron enzyme [Anaerolineae bacterium]|nr:SUMF1/EgtB/PvdO family nonheme iron enzyme [Anaerolineae bacterium]
MAHIFLSYSHEDVDLMARMRADMRAAHLDVWTDEGIQPGTPSWKRAVEEAIKGAGCVISILSPDASNSRWVREELDFAEAQEKRIFLVLARGNSDDVVPFGFSSHQWIDARTSYAPITNRLIPAICAHLGADCASEPVDAGDKPAANHPKSEPRPQPQPDPVAESTPRPALETVAPRRSPALRIFLGIAGLVIAGAAVYLVATRVLQARSPGYAADNRIVSNAQWTPTSQTFDGVEMVLVPTGCFMMGSDNGDGDEQPINPQCFDEPFWIDRYEVTNAQFNRLGGRASESVALPEPDQPRVATWFEAAAFCADKRAGRLPTEAEWEYAARGPDALEYPWGNTFVAANVANENLDAPTRVGRYPEGASWVGVFDMSGNVWEWASTIYAVWESSEFPYPYVSDDGREDMERTDVSRVRRGGSFNDDEYIFRGSYRNSDDPHSYDNMGFRCVRPH